MVTEPVEQGGGELLVEEDLHPLTEGEVGGDQAGAAHVALGVTRRGRRDARTHID